MTRNTTTTINTTAWILTGKTSQQLDIPNTPTIADLAKATGATRLQVLDILQHFRTKTPNLKQITNHDTTTPQAQQHHHQLTQTPNHTAPWYTIGKTTEQLLQAQTETIIYHPENPDIHWTTGPRHTRTQIHPTPYFDQNFRQIYAFANTDLTPLQNTPTIHQTTQYFPTTRTTHQTFIKTTTINKQHTIINTPTGLLPYSHHHTTQNLPPGHIQPNTPQQLNPTHTTWTWTHH